ncbi:MAG: zinc dependent phospholipase C family protein [Chitinophagaceae bacterium]
MRKLLALALLLLLAHTSFCWGFYAHRKINQYAVFLLPPEMMVLYKIHIAFLEEHAVDPDKRRYAIPEEGPRHYIDIDHYGTYPYDSLPRKWNDAVARYSEDTLNTYGIVPWWLQTMLYRLTDAFKEKNQARILKYSAEIGHYIADSHVPLHATKNHNGQYTDQKGIHGFWESRIPELLAEKEWDFFIGKAEFIKNPADFIWTRVMESAAAADTVLKFEKELSLSFPPDLRFAFEDRNGQMIRQYSSSYSKAYNDKLRGMVERRMRQSIFAVASFWYTAWVNAGQPDLTKLSNKNFSPEDLKEFETLNNAWKNSGTKGREHETPNP